MRRDRRPANPFIELFVSFGIGSGRCFHPSKPVQRWLMQKIAGDFYAAPQGFQIARHFEEVLDNTYLVKRVGRPQEYLPTAFRVQQHRPQAKAVLVRPLDTWEPHMGIARRAPEQQLDIGRRQPGFGFENPCNPPGSTVAGPVPNRCARTIDVAILSKRIVARNGPGFGRLAVGCTAR